MFIADIVLEWRAPGEKRIPDAAGNLYILNTNRMFEITEAYDGNATMFYFDNPSDIKDGGARLRTDYTVASLIAQADTDYGAENVTLDYYPNADSTESTVSIIIPKEDIAYCYPYGNVQSHALSWVVYALKGWGMKKILVNHSWIPLIVLLEA